MLAKLLNKLFGTRAAEQPSLVLPKGADIYYRPGGVVIVASLLRVYPMAAPGEPRRKFLQVPSAVELGQAVLDAVAASHEGQAEAEIQIARSETGT